MQKIRRHRASPATHSISKGGKVGAWGASIMMVVEDEAEEEKQFELPDYDVPRLVVDRPGAGRSFPDTTVCKQRQRQRPTGLPYRPPSTNLAAPTGPHVSTTSTRPPARPHPTPSSWRLRDWGNSNQPWSERSGHAVIIAPLKMTKAFGAYHAVLRDASGHVIRVRVVALCCSSPSYEYRTGLPVISPRPRYDPRHQ